MIFKIMAYAVTEVAGTPYAYDFNGNLTDNGIRSFTWDVKNQLTETGDFNYAYDHTGRKVLSHNVAGGGSTLYVNSYMDIRDGEKTYYIFADSMRLAALEGPDLFMYHADHLGGTAVTTNGAGETIQLYDYYPFGASLVDEQLTDTETHYGFTGKELEEGTGLHYFEARWYDAATGKFTSIDPMQLTNVQDIIGDPQALNAYAYSRNNPLKYVDPDGREFKLKAAVTSFVQTGKAGANVVSAVVTGTIATVVAPASTIVPAGEIVPAALTIGTLASIDDALVDSTNALNNAVNAFQGEEPETIMEQGPIMDAFNAIGLETELVEDIQVFTDVSTSIVNLAGSAKNLVTASYDTAVDGLKGVMQVYHNAFETTDVIHQSISGESINESIEGVLVGD